MVECPHCGEMVVVEIPEDVPQPVAEEPASEPVQSAPIESFDDYSTEEPKEEFVEEVVAEAAESYQETVAEEVESEIEAPSENFSGVESYANSEDSAAREGYYLYNLVIEGVDSGDLKTELREALTDRRFRWDADEVMGQLTNGRLELQKLNAVKATVLVHRLKGLPMRVFWTQKIVPQLVQDELATESLVENEGFLSEESDNAF